MPGGQPDPAPSPGPAPGPHGAPRGPGVPGVPGVPLTVVLDVANVMGSRPDGWWRDRAGAAERMLAAAVAVVGRRPGTRVVAVLEGRARSATPPACPGLEVVLAPADGDDAVVVAAERGAAEGRGDGGRLVVVTADRGLRERLPAAAEAVGPSWWHDLVGEGG